jgi:hypothetical protein
MTRDVERSPECLHCGYALRGLTTARCPECGRAFDPTDPATFTRPKPVAPSTRDIGVVVLGVSMSVFMIAAPWFVLRDFKLAPTSVVAAILGLTAAILTGAMDAMLSRRRPWLPPVAIAPACVLVLLVESSNARGWIAVSLVMGVGGAFLMRSLFAGGTGNPSQ